MRGNLKRILAVSLVLCAFLACSLVPSYADVKVSDLDGLRAGVMTGTPQDEIVNNAVKNAKLSYYNNFTDMALALKENKIDFYVNSDVSFMMMKDQYPEFTKSDESLTDFDLGIIFPKNTKGQKLCDQVNEYIAQIKDDGTLKKLRKYWISPKDRKPLTLPKTGKNGTLKLATSSSVQPFAYEINGKPAGFDIAILKGFCEAYGYGITMSDMDLGTVVAAVGTGKYDLGAGQISYTPERAESMLFSDSYYKQHIVAIYKAKGSIIARNDQTFIEKIENNVYRTFVKEQRWQLILEGLGNTVVLTILAAILGQILGYGIFLLRTGRRRVARAFARVYIKVLQGTPIVVLLLIMYYLIFGDSNIAGFWVAVITFTLNFAAYAAEIMRSGVEGIDRGQWEAALALGYTERQTFYKFILPQAAVRFMPVLKGQIISLLKGTSIVGYIAIMDLTKAGDIIRSRTYDAFFSLISTAIIYFILAWLLALVLDRIEIRMNPRQRKKGGGDHE